MRHQVIHTHGNKVNAKAAIVTNLACKFQFCADAVGGSDKNRIGEAGSTRVKQPPKSAEPGIGAGAPRACRMRSYGADERISSIDIDARIAIAERFLRWCGI